MASMNTPENLFLHGSRWLRADFHLHTRADKEFSYNVDEDYYSSNYIRTLESANIEIGVITNHNKFALEEFKALRKTARKKGIFLLPGVELCVGDGANGIHTLIVFHDEWISNGQDYINQFLNIAFEGKTAANAFGQFFFRSPPSPFGVAGSQSVCHRVPRQGGIRAAQKEI